MRKEIQEELFALDNESKKVRRREGRNFLIIVGVVFGLFLLVYFIPNFVFALIFLLGLLWGAFYIIVTVGPLLYKPLSDYSYAFRHISKAIEILEKCSKKEGFEEASQQVKKAYQILKETYVPDIDWYDEINETLTTFTENLELIVYPAVTKSKIKIQDLEEVAIALASRKSSEIEKVNRMLEAEPTYGKIEPPPQKAEVFVKWVKENKSIRFLLANITSFFAVLLSVWVHSIMFQNSFMEYFSNITNFLAFLAIVVAVGYGIYDITKRIQK